MLRFSWSTSISLITNNNTHYIPIIINNVTQKSITNFEYNTIQIEWKSSMM